MNLSDLSPDDVTADQTLAQNTQPMKLSNLKRDDVDFVPGTATEAKYGSPLQQLTAFPEAFNRGLTFGTSDLAEAAAGRAGVGGMSQEDISGRQEANPVTSFIGSALGAAVPLYLTGGASALAPSLGRVGGMAAEGTLFGAGNVVSEQALGDPDHSAGHIAAHVGMGTLLGTGAGLFSKALEAMGPIFRRAPKAAETAPAGTIAEAEGVAPKTEKMTMGNARSLDELDEALKNSDEAKYGGGTALETRDTILDAQSRLTDLENPMFEAQKMALDSKTANDAFKVIRESPTREGDIVRRAESLQKRELYNKTNQLIDSIAPDAEMAATKAEAGESARDVLAQKISDTEDMLGPKFEEVKKIPIAPLENEGHIKGAINEITNKVPEVSKMFDLSGPEVKIKPFSSSWELDEAAYNKVAKMVKEMKSNPPETVGDLMGYRRSILPPKEIPASDQLYPIKSGMLEYINKTAGSDVRENVLKPWAINAEQANVIKKSFGAAINDNGFSQISKTVPENVLDKMFNNSSTVRAAKNILKDSPGKFEEMLKDWVGSKMKDFTPDGQYSSAKMSTFLRKESDVLNEAFADSPDKLQRLKDLVVSTRHLPDAVSINPSGTAKTGAAMMQDFAKDLIKGGEGPKEALMRFLKEKLIDKYKEIKSERTFNGMMQNKQDAVSKIGAIKKISDNVTGKIKSAAKDMVSSRSGQGGILGGAIMMSDKDYKEKVARLKELSIDSQMMLDHTSDSIAGIHDAAPNIAQGVANSMMNAVQFLSSKIPAPSQQMVLSPDFEPTTYQKLRFSSYYNAINDPLSVMAQVKNGVLSNDSMEALSAVHPKLLQEMRQKVFEHMKPDNLKVMNFSKKMALSKFLGQPLDQNMLPAAIAANQQSFQMPSMSNQSAPQGGKRTPLGPMKQLKLSSRVATRSEQEEEET